MAAPQNQHEAAVAAWLRSVANRGRLDTVDAFERALTALWKRSHLTLGEVTLTAIVARVLQSASEQYPALAAIVVDESGLQCDGLRTAPGLDEAQTRTALSFVLVEFLTVLGNLTAEILTPALHDELAKCSPRQSARMTGDEAR